jgi:hypothetical protein
VDYATLIHPVRAPRSRRAREDEGQAGQRSGVKGRAHLSPDDKAGVVLNICEPTQIEATDNLDGNHKVMGRRGILGLLAGGAATLLSGCLKPHESLRYRLTLEVQTPEGIRTGSSVLQNDQYGASIIPLPGDIGGAGNIGEAPTVDLGGGRFLFAVLADPL